MLDHNAESYDPYFLRKVYGYFNIPCQQAQREDAGDGVLDLFFLSEMNRMSNNLQMLQQRKHDLLHHFRPLSVASV